MVLVISDFEVKRISFRARVICAGVIWNILTIITASGENSSWVLNAHSESFLRHFMIKHCTLNETYVVFEGFYVILLTEPNVSKKTYIAFDTYCMGNKWLELR